MLKKFLSLLVVSAIVLGNLAYADTVVIGVAPGTADGRTISANANTTYLQNQYTGPGTLPNSQSTGISPIQLNYNATTNYADANGTSNTSPTTRNLTSPTANHNVLSANYAGTGVVSNAATNVSRVTDTSTADKGPTVAADIAHPSAKGENSITSSNAIGPDGDSTVPNTANIQEVQVNTTSAPVTTALIAYHMNDYIQAVRPNISAEGAMVVNATTRQIYFGVNPLTKYHPASLANIVTAAILIANKKLDDVLTVSATAISNLESGAVIAKLKVGDTITVRDAIGAMFVGSCCDVSNVVAENVAGSIANFVNIMNQTVKSWGCVSTNFTNPTGLNDDNQVTTAYDMAIIMDKASANSVLKLMMQQEMYVLPATATRRALTLTSKNKLLAKSDVNYYQGISSSRMGYTSKALYTMASEIDYNGQKLIAVVLKANKTQWDDTKKLLNFAKVASLEPSSQNVQQYVTTFNSASNQQQQSQQQAATTPSVGYVEVTNADVHELPTGNLRQQTNTATQTTNVITQNANQTASATIVQNANQAASATIVQNANNSTQQTNSQSANTEGSWGQDTNGWYFIKQNGTRAANEWVVQNGKYYCIDSTGYMIKGWRQMSNGNTYYFDTSSGELKRNTWINVSTGAYYLQADGALVKADAGTTKNITTSVGVYTIDDTGKAIARVS
ncbi:MAG: hypothetical protein IJ593_07090 [Lachnospiraceae bacterium]|nr:hypothetical protein [Lachnospiraceae bacterium]